MRAKISRRIVVDASVARAAGGEEAVFPLSKHCRDFLKTMLTVCHRAVLTAAVRQEWKKHESTFARQWRVAMMARKKLVLTDTPEDSALREAIEEAASGAGARRAMLKDVHLVEAAHATDGTVVSLDDAVRGLFGAAATRVGSLRHVVWVNPGHEDEGSNAWLEEGAPAEGRRSLLAWRRKA